MVIYPLSRRYRGRDLLNRGKTAYLRGVYPARGPTMEPNTAYRFVGSSQSYIQFPNRGRLDARNSMTMIAWINPIKPGPIFNYRTNGWGCHLWVTNPRQLFVRFVKRNGGFTAAIVANVLWPGKWNYVAAVYNKRTGRASLWKDTRRVASRYIGKITLRTQEDVRMGARIGDRRYFKGRISCMQIYGRALTSLQQRSVKYICTKGNLFEHLK